MASIAPRPPRHQDLRVLLALAGTCCTGPGGGALLLAQADWLIVRLRTWGPRTWNLRTWPPAGMLQTLVGTNVGRDKRW